MTKTVRHVHDDERRARLAMRHALAPSARAESPEAVAQALVALHGTEPASIPLSCWARMDAVTRDDVDAAFHSTRTLVRQVSMRQTLFGVRRDVLPAVHGTVCRRFAARARAQLVHGVAKAGVSGSGATEGSGATAEDGVSWVQRACEAVLAELDKGEPLTAREIREGVPEAVGSYDQGAGTRWASTVQLTPKVIGLLHLEGAILRAGYEGDWRNQRPRWTTTTRWWGAPVTPLDERAGHAELVRRWLFAYGPGTDADIAWWLGTTKGAVRTALAQIGALPVSVTGSELPGWLLPDDLEPVAAPEPWVALLPLLDPTVMGWRDRGFVLGDHAPALFDSVGNAGTTILVDGRVVGVWVQDDDQRVRSHLLEPVTSAQRDAIAADTDRLTAWLDGQRVFSVYPSPAMRDALA